MDVDPPPLRKLGPAHNNRQGYMLTKFHDVSRVSNVIVSSGFHYFLNDNKFLYKLIITK